MEFNIPPVHFYTHMLYLQHNKVLRHFLLDEHVFFCIAILLTSPVIEFLKIYKWILSQSSNYLFSRLLLISHIKFSHFWFEYYSNTSPSLVVCSYLWKIKLVNICLKYCCHTIGWCILSLQKEGWLQ